MAADTLCMKSLREISDLIRRRACSSLEVTEAALSRARLLDPVLHTFITIDEAGALDAAKRADKALAQDGHVGPLHGIPISVKDQFATRNLRTTLASSLYADYVPDFDAGIVERIRAAGGVIIGKANMYELGTGWGTFGHFPLTLNPWNASYSPGGSSSGSAAGVAAGLAYASLASDGGGSVRVPSNYCGVVGLKPTHGRVSYYGSLPMMASWGDKQYVASKTISAAGVIARTVEDAAIVLQVVAGWDGRDPGSEEVPVPDFIHSLNDDARGMVVGIPRAYIDLGISHDNARAFERAIDVIKDAGALIVDLQSPQSLDQIGWMWTTIAYVEMAAQYGRQFQSDPDSFGPELQDRIKTGLATSGAEYFLATQARQKLRAEWSELLKHCDVVATPTAPAEPPTMAELKARRSDLQNIGELARYTRPYNMTGFPAITVPDGFSSAGLPLGLQLGGRPFDEASIMRVAHAYQQHSEWHHQRAVDDPSTYVRQLAV